MHFSEMHVEYWVSYYYIHTYTHLQKASQVFSGFVDKSHKKKNDKIKLLRIESEKNYESKHYHLILCSFSCS